MNSMGNVIFQPLKSFLQKFLTHINANDIKHYKYEKKFSIVITNLIVIILLY